MGNGLRTFLSVVAALLVGFALGHVFGGIRERRVGDRIAPKTEQAQEDEGQAAADSDAARLARAKERIESQEKLIRELEKKLAEAERKPSKKDLAALFPEAANVEAVTVDLNKEGDGDLMGELKKRLPAEQFDQVTNAFSKMRAQLANREKGKQAYLAGIDTSEMTDHERKNHTRYQELLAKREEIRSKMKGGLPNASNLQELVQLEMEMAPIAKEERSALIRQMARELGYTGEAVDVIRDTAENIIDCTGSGGLGAIGDLGNGIGPGVEIKTHVIGL